MAISHSDQLTIQRANEGLRELTSCIEDLDRLSKRLVLVLGRANFADTALMPVGNSIMAIVTKHFEGQEALRLGEAAVLTDIDASRIKTEDDLRRAIETRIAHSKDLLEEGKQLLQRRIRKLSGALATEPLSKVASTEVAPKTDASFSAPPNSKKNPLISLKPSFAGVSIDLVELWRRIQGK
jgi:hypothetical protein